MTVIPKLPTPLAARTSADFVEKVVRWEDTIGGTPADITGWTLRFVVKASALEETPVLEATIGDGIALTDPENGELVVTFDKAALIEAMPENVKRFEGVYELQAVSPAGVDEVWLEGQFVMLRGL